MTEINILLDFAVHLIYGKGIQVVTIAQGGNKLYLV